MRLSATLSLPICLLLLPCCRKGISEEFQQDWADEAPFDEGAAIEDAIAEYSWSTYENIFGSYQCTYDCSGHNAGFDWAKENMILDGYSCSGESDSFGEGCEAYGEAIAEYVETARADHP